MIILAKPANVVSLSTNVKQQDIEISCISQTNRGSNQHHVNGSDRRGRRSWDGNLEIHGSIGIILVRF